MLDLEKIELDLHIAMLSKSFHIKEDNRTSILLWHAVLTWMEKITKLVNEIQLNLIDDLIDDLIEIFQKNNVDTLSKSELINLLDKQKLDININD